MGGVDEIWDGNGGTLDPKKAPQRDLLVALHVKMDSVVIPKLNDLETRLRNQENGVLTLGQLAAVRTMLQGDADAQTNRRALRMPVWALLVSCLALVTSVLLTVAAFTGGAL